jgi:transportin-1
VLTVLIHFQKLEEFNKYPDFNNYLCFVFKYLDAAQVDLRNMAGIMLKNNIRDYFDKIHPASVEYIRTEAPGLLGDPMLGIRQTCGSILTTILLKIGPQNWPDLLTNLAEAIGSDSAELVDGAFSTLEKICEDHAEELQKDAMGRPLSAIIPKLIATMTSQVEKIRLYSLNCLLYLVPFTPNALLSNIEPFLNVQ